MVRGGRYFRRGFGSPVSPTGRASSSCAVGMPSRAPERVVDSGAAAIARRGRRLQAETRGETRGEGAVERVAGARRCRPPSTAGAGRSSGSCVASDDDGTGRAERRRSPRDGRPRPRSCGPAGVAAATSGRSPARPPRPIRRLSSPTSAASSPRFGREDVDDAEHRPIEPVGRRRVEDRRRPGLSCGPERRLDGRGRDLVADEHDVAGGRHERREAPRGRRPAVSSRSHPTRPR